MKNQIRLEQNVVLLGCALLLICALFVAVWFAIGSSNTALMPPVEVSDAVHLTAKNAKTFGFFAVAGLIALFELK